MFRHLRHWQARHFARRHPFPENEWTEARARLPLLSALAEDDAQRLGHRAWRFLHDKRVSLHPDLVESSPLDLPANLALTAQVCLLTLGWSDADHREAFANVHEIQILPDAFRRRVEEMDEFGVMHEYDDERAGETSFQGPVVVSFPDLMASGEWNGFNVLIHEFAHKLDLGNASDVDGFPPLPRELDPREWHRRFTAVWDDLQARIQRREATPIDDYAATHPGECFAVCCEYFFSAPDTLNDAYPALYELLCRYFRQNPLTRLPDDTPHQPSSSDATSQSQSNDASSRG